MTENQRKVLALLDQGMQRQEIARTLGISKSTVTNTIQKHRPELSKRTVLLPLEKRKAIASDYKRMAAKDVTELHGVSMHELVKIKAEFGITKNVKHKPTPKTAEPKPVELIHVDHLWVPPASPAIRVNYCRL